MDSHKKNKLKELQSISSFFDATRDYLIFLVTLSSSFEILATILEGLSKEEIINFEFTLFSSTGLLLLFIGGLIPSTLGLFYISFGKKFIARENIKKAEFTYLSVRRFAIIASVCFLIGFSLISIPTFFESILPFAPSALRIGFPILFVSSLAFLIISYIKTMLEKDNYSSKIARN